MNANTFNFDASLLNSLSGLSTSSIMDKLSCTYATSLYLDTMCMPTGLNSISADSIKSLLQLDTLSTMITSV